MRTTTVVWFSRAVVQVTCLILIGPLDAWAQEAERLLKTTAVVRAMDEGVLRGLVPLQSGLRFVGCPNCTGGVQEGQLAWSVERPDEVACRFCRHRYPSEKYPMHEAVVVRNPRGEPARFDYWVNDKGYRYFFKARRDFEVRQYLASQTLSLARLYSTTGHKPHARRAAVILDRFAQVFPGWCYHYDYPFRQKEFDDGDVPTAKFRPGFRTARWNWWAYLDIPSDLVEAFHLIRDSGVLEDLSIEQGVDVAARIRDDLLRNAGEQVLANPETYSNMSPIAWTALVKLGRTIDEPRYVHEVVRRFRTLIERQFFYDGFWHEGSPSYGSQAVSSLDAVLSELRGYSDPPEHIDPIDAMRFDKVDLEAEFPLIGQARSALENFRLPNGRVVPVHDAWAMSEPLLHIESGPSYLLPALGHACARHGAGPHRSEFHLSWSGGYGHQHADLLSLILFSNSRELISDLGYTHSAYRSWTLATASHNTVVIDGRSQAPGSIAAPTDGSLRLIDFTNPRVQVISTDAVRAYPGLAKSYRRTLVVVDAGEEDRYAVDLFEVEGGQTHDYFLHSDADGPTRLTASLELMELPTLLPQGFSWKPTANEGEAGRAYEPHYAYGFLRNMQSAALIGGAPVSIDWQSPDGTPAGLRVTLLPEDDSQLVVGENPSIRLAREDDTQLDRHQRPFMMLRHRATAGRSMYVSILESFGNQPFISSAKRMDLGDGAVGLLVSIGDRTDVIVIGAATEVSVAARSGDADRACFQGHVGVLSLRGGTLEHAYSLGDGGWHIGNFELSSRAPKRAPLVRVEHDSLVVADDGAPPPIAGDVVRLLTDDGWVYPYNVKFVELVDGGLLLRIGVAEGPGLNFDADKRHLQLRSFPQREHAGEVQVEWLASAATSPNDSTKHNGR
ncbi:MAG: heparinase II/III family protein [Planctomycetales bacterium]